jgi:hypothetical protein
MEGRKVFEMTRKPAWPSLLWLKLLPGERHRKTHQQPQTKHRLTDVLVERILGKAQH